MFDKLMFTRFTMLILVVGMMGGGCSSSDEEPVQVVEVSQPDADAGILFHDPLTTPPTEPWRWVRENPLAHRTTPQGLGIRLEPGRLMGDGRDAKNILVRPLPDGTKSVSVRVDASHKTQYEQGGLILYHGDDDYIKVVKEMVDGKVYVLMVVEIKMQAFVVNKVPCPEPDVWIGLELGAKSVNSLCWGNDKKRIAVAVAEFPLSPAPRIGVFTQNGQPGADRWVVFSDFMISSEKCLASE